MLKEGRHCHEGLCKIVGDYSQWIILTITTNVPRDDNVKQKHLLIKK